MLVAQRSKNTGLFIVSERIYNYNRYSGHHSVDNASIDTTGGAVDKAKHWLMFDPSHELGLEAKLSQYACKSLPFDYNHLCKGLESIDERMYQI